MNRLSDGFIGIQLELVERHVALGLGSWGSGIGRLTNLRRRLGLSDDRRESTWQSLLRDADDLAALDPIAARLGAVRDELPEPTPEHLRQEWPTCGAFSIQVEGDAARTHFFATDEDDLSPLHPSKLALRQAELDEVLSRVRADTPDLRRVIGGSWLYSLPSYAGLFPAAHLAGARVRRGRDRFNGMSHWGQLVDHRGDLSPARASAFRTRLAAWTGGDLCDVFPTPTLDLDSPIGVFDD